MRCLAGERGGHLGQRVTHRGVDDLVADLDARAAEQLRVHVELGFDLLAVALLEGGDDLGALGVVERVRAGDARAHDLLVVALLFPLWLPVMTLVALWVAITSPGPIFYRQPRIGFKGSRFMLIKFRTMKVNAETHVHEAYLEHLIVSDRPMIKLDATDPRLILGGRFLRAIGLDELPQIFNVLRGEMSLVGPRPCTVTEFERYAPEQRARVNALPGLTGLWQVNGKNKTTFREMIEMDIFYSRNISLSLDLKIILRTVPAIIGQLSDSARPLPEPSAQSSPPVKT